MSTLPSKSKPPSRAMPQQQVAAKQSHHVKNLASILAHFLGLDLMIELKNGRIYRGTLHEADDYMNLVLKNGSASSIHPAHQPDSEASTARADDKLIKAVDFDIFQIRGPSIRYIHFPPNADLPRLVKLGLDRVKSAKDKYKRGKRNRRSPTT